MSWLTNFVRPKFHALVGKKDVPDNLWHKCKKCSQMLFHRELEQNMFVCGHCGHHMRITAKQRLDLLMDEGEYTRIELPEVAVDPLKFRDRERYSDRLKAAHVKTGEHDAIVVVHGVICGHPAVLAVFDFRFMGGSMGQYVGEGIIAAAKLARLQQVPLIVVTSSGGARMQEGILSLVQMPRTVIAVDDVRAAGLPYIVVLADPTTGGVTASFAMMGDIQIAEPGSTIGFTGARVIEQTIRERLPEGFQSAESALDHGLVDMVVPRHELKTTLARIISLLLQRTPTAEVIPLQTGEPAATATAAEAGEQDSQHAD